ncbi:hypothetical protein MN0502_33950 (plasmid) [Arthrobacter sp. MN05-02]|nr:hypothetical protein MN0502_33950 [Arthrobacter sp. MN05-02]
MCVRYPFKIARIQAYAVTSKHIAIKIRFLECLIRVQYGGWVWLSAVTPAPLEDEDNENNGSDDINAKRAYSSFELELLEGESFIIGKQSRSRTMAQRVQVELVDDLNGDVADETVRFGVDGTEYEIDLTMENAEKLRSALSEYVEKGRKAKVGRRGQGGQSSASSSPSKSKREETQKIRQWAQENGHNPSSRGRITQAIVDAYNNAH